MCVRVCVPAYLIRSRKVLEEALSPTEQSLILGTDDYISHVPVGAEGVQQQLFPVRQAEGRQHHKVILIPHQEGRDGEGLWRLVSA